MPSSLEWDLAKGADFFYVKWFAVARVHHRSPGLNRNKVVNIPDYFDFRRDKVEVPHLFTLKRTLDGPQRIVCRLKKWLIRRIGSLNINGGGFCLGKSGAKRSDAVLYSGPQSVLLFLVVTSSEQDGILFGEMKLPFKKMRSQLVVKGIL